MVWESAHASVVVVSLSAKSIPLRGKYKITHVLFLQNSLKAMWDSVDIELKRLESEGLDVMLYTDVQWKTFASRCAELPHVLVYFIPSIVFFCVTPTPILFERKHALKDHVTEILCRDWLRSLWPTWRPLCEQLKFKVNYFCHIINICLFFPFNPLTFTVQWT